MGCSRFSSCTPYRSPSHTLSTRPSIPLNAGRLTTPDNLTIVPIISLGACSRRAQRARPRPTRPRSPACTRSAAVLCRASSTACSRSAACSAASDAASFSCCAFAAANRSFERRDIIYIKASGRVTITQKIT
eukprot:246530-Prymnesium_polylepis.1